MVVEQLLFSHEMLVQALMQESNQLTLKDKKQNKKDENVKLLECR